LVSTLRRDKYENLICEYGWELVRGKACFDDHKRLRVDDRVITADGVLLATGARPAVPPIAGLDRVDFLTSTSVLELKVLPEHLIVSGAGYIGLELLAVPGVTFTTPSIATVGLTAQAAREAGHDVKATALPLGAVPRALVNRPRFHRDVRAVPDHERGTQACRAELHP
jgi:pyruvate/2-oxoglutarate dehydrogenase complex dihydrolipoamide dehydrogenase (E3) component